MAETKDLLFEIGTEEMPSAPLMNAVKQLSPLMERGLTEAGLAHGPVRVVSSPRRLAVLVDAVATATDEVHEVKRGPAANIAFDADGNPTKAAEGFARKCGMTAAELVQREDTDGRTYVFAERNNPSARVAQLPKPALGLDARDLRAPYPLDLRAAGHRGHSRSLCRRNEREHHTWSSCARAG